MDGYLISIHALLAESDCVRCFGCFGVADFYPRSPCGERLPSSTVIVILRINFYPRSPCGERRWLRCWQLAARDISIHALLAESDNLRVLDGSKSSIISIHALLAESDYLATREPYYVRHFYPRSPCGERPSLNLMIRHAEKISIHALLAESDPLR